MSAHPTHTHSAETLISTLLSLTETHIIPLTRTRVSSGSKLFGAAILTKSSLTPLTVESNNERVSPLLHGEINCIQTFFTETDPNQRPATKDCIFFATHEPCSLCLSGITWSGFNEFYYLFTYEDSRDLFGIPYDIDILQSVFQVPPTPSPNPPSPSSSSSTQQRPLYNRTNKFFTARSIADLVATLPTTPQRTKWTAEIARVKEAYTELSETYQKGKVEGTATSSVFQ